MKRCLTLLVATTSLLAVRPAVASCAGPPQGGQELFETEFRAAKVVFIGTVVRLRLSDPRFAVVRVEEVQKGPPLPNEVEVQGAILGNPQPPDAPIQERSSVDRDYRLGGRYLFMFDNAKMPFKDSACGPTRDLAGGFPGKRAIDSEPEAAAEKTSADIPWAAAGAGTAAILAALVGLGLADRRRRAQV